MRKVVGKWEYVGVVRLAISLTAALLVSAITGLRAQTPVLLETTTAADLERDAVASERMFLSYVDRVKLAPLMADNPVLAKDLRAYFHENVKGGTIAQGIMDFDVKMQHLEHYAEEHKKSLTDYPSTKIADLVWDQALQQEKAKLGR